MPATPLKDSIPICLEIKGNIIPFKNRKRVYQDSSGRLHTATESKVRDHMNVITRSFEFQLLAIFRDGVTVTGCSLQSWIASSMPGDDSLDWIPLITVTGKRVKPGFEKTIVTIEKL